MYLLALKFLEYAKSQSTGVSDMLLQSQFAELYYEIANAELSLFKFRQATVYASKSVNESKSFIESAEGRLKALKRENMLNGNSDPLAAQDQDNMEAFLMNQ